VIDLAGHCMPAPQALASATGGAANACRIADRTGRLRAGLAADLLLVDGDPARDGTALLDVRMVGRGVCYSVAMRRPRTDERSSQQRPTAGGTANAR
jgi:imidazolonepropionase-like amidohydrolase